MGFFRSHFGRKQYKDFDEWYAVFSGKGIHKPVNKGRMLKQLGNHPLLDSLKDKLPRLPDSTLEVLFKDPLLFAKKVGTNFPLLLGYSNAAKVFAHRLFITKQTGYFGTFIRKRAASFGHAVHPDFFHSLGKNKVLGLQPFVGCVKTPDLFARLNVKRLLESMHPRAVHDIARGMHWQLPSMMEISQLEKFLDLNPQTFEIFWSSFSAADALVFKWSPAQAKSFGAALKKQRAISKFSKAVGNNIFEMLLHMEKTKNCITEFCKALGPAGVEQLIAECPSPRKLRSLLLSHKFNLELKQVPQHVLRCPYCHDKLKRNESAVQCDDCHALMHYECEQELGHCPSCQRSKRFTRRTLVAMK